MRSICFVITLTAGGSGPATRAPPPAPPPPAETEEERISARMHAERRNQILCHLKEIVEANEKSFIDFQDALHLDEEATEGALSQATAAEDDDDSLDTKILADMKKLRHSPISELVPGDILGLNAHEIQRYVMDKKMAWLGKQAVSSFPPPQNSSLLKEGLDRMDLPKTFVCAFELLVDPEIEAKTMWISHDPSSTLTLLAVTTNPAVVRSFTTVHKMALDSALEQKGERKPMVPTVYIPICLLYLVKSLALPDKTALVHDSFVVAFASVLHYTIAYFMHYRSPDFVLTDKQTEILMKCLRIMPPLGRETRPSERPKIRPQDSDNPGILLLQAFDEEFNVMSQPP